MESAFLTIARKDEVAVAAAAAARGGAAPTGVEMKTLLPDSAAVDVGDYGTESSGNDAIAALRQRAEASDGSSGGAWNQFTSHFFALGLKCIRLAMRDRWGCIFQFLIPIVVVLIDMALLSNSGEDDCGRRRGSTCCE